MEPRHIIYLSGLVIPGRPSPQCGFLSGYDANQRPILVPDPCYAAHIVDKDDAIVECDNIHHHFHNTLSWIFETDKARNIEQRPSSMLESNYRDRLVELAREHSNIHSRAERELRDVNAAITALQAGMETILNQHRQDEP